MIQGDFTVLMLYHLKSEIKAKGTTIHRLSETTGIDTARLDKIVYPTKNTEPWFDEAVLLHRALCTAGILPLIGAPSLEAVTGLPIPLPNDLDYLRADVRLPLGLACNIALQLGLTDPVELIVTPLQRQIWSVVSSGERIHPLSRHGRCPWCASEIVDGAGHLSTCLAENLLGDRGLHVTGPLGSLPRPPRRNEGGGSLPAKGLKSIRERMSYTQAQMAALLGTQPNAYAQLERCERPLTLRMAKRFAQASRIDMALFYAEPSA